MDIGLVLVADSVGGGGSIYVDVQSHTFEKFRATGNSRVDGNFTVGGNLNIIGTETKTTVKSLDVADQFIYVGGGDTVTAAFTGTGLNDLTFKGHYTGDSDVQYNVRISNDSGDHDKIQWSFDSTFSTLEPFESAGGPTEYTLDSSKLTILLKYGISAKFEAVDNHDSGDVWKGDAAPSNVDFGFSGNYNDSQSSYTHAGFFRDASDGRFKFFSSYDSEPSGIINTDHSSFNLADIQAANFHGALTGNVTGQVSTLSNHSTTNLSEGTNLYYTQARVDSDAGALIDSAYVQARTAAGTDSAATQAMIDSNLVELLDSINVKYISINSTEPLPSAPGTNAIAIGPNATTDAARHGFVGVGDGTIAIGDSANAIGHNSVAIGTEATTGEDNYYIEGVSIGRRAKGYGSRSTAIGSGAEAAQSSFAGGQGAKARAIYSIAIGQQANVDSSYDHSVAIGRLAEPDQSNQLRLGDDTTDFGFSSIRVGLRSYSPSDSQDLATKHYVDSQITVNLGNAGTDSSSVVAIIDSHVTRQFIDSLNVDASTLGGRDSSYLLNYNNFTNTPTIPVLSKTNIDALNVDADTLDNQDGSYYLAYANFTGTPDILDSSEIKNIFNSTGDNQLETERVVGLEYLEFVHDSDVTTFLVEVASKTAAHRYEGTGSSQGYVIRNQESPFMQFVPGNKYRFDQSNGTNVSHQIRFYYDAAKTTEYTSGVTFAGTAGSAGAYTEIEITDDTPLVLHYQCINHGYMGNAVFVQTRNLTGFTTDDLNEGTSNLYHTTARVESIVDSAYVQARVNLRDSGFVTGLIDSAYIANIVDSAYIKLREQDSDALAADGGGVDSAATISLIQATVDSAYVAAREALSGGGAANAFKNFVVSGQDSVVADNATDTLTFEAGSNITITTDANTDTITIASTGGGGGGGTADGITIDKFVFTADSAQTVFTDSDDNGDILTYNTADTQINVFLNGILQVDSDDFAMTDSNTVTLTSGANLGDILQVIKYSPPSPVESGVDSAATISLIKATADSSYVSARTGVYQRGTLEVNKFFFEADSGDTTFSGSDKFSNTLKVDAGNTEVYLNGILQELTTDYTITDSSVTFTEALDSGYSVSIVEMIGRVNTVSTLFNAVFEFDADSGQTVFTGNDRDGVALDLTNGVTDVYLNGILLSSENDYTIADTTITLLDSADSGDFLAIVNRKGVMTSSLNTKQFYFTNVVGFTISGNGLAYSGNIQIFKNGDPLVQGTDFTAKDGTTITLTDNAIASDKFVIHTFSAGSKIAANTYDFLATASQTEFSGEDRFGTTLDYITNENVVYLNGIALIESADYSILNHRTLRLVTAADSGDELKIVSYAPASLGSLAAPMTLKNFEYTATAGQTVFTDSDDNGEILSYTTGKVNVFLNGLMLASSDFTANNDSSVTLTLAADSGDIIAIQKFTGNNIGLDSAETRSIVTGEIDSAYISKIVDSDFVSARQANSSVWEEHDSTGITLTSNTKNIIDCSSSAINLTLPANPVLGDEIRIIDGTGNAATNNITLLRNGSNIQGEDSDFTIDVDRAGIGFVYYNATQGWILIEN